ncbi:MAG TPA: lipid A deacylase LpxR family protein [Bacteroidales bacterium]|jgi:hypothetical protein|nr:lipid A deacylase LpxR family protein [Bacteroidales bacterium]
MIRFTPIIFLLMLAACSSPTSKSPSAGAADHRKVIDHPAIVVYSAEKTGITREMPAVRKAARFSADHNIPLVSTTVESLEFVKQNGSRIILDISRLPLKSNIILFNSVSDPVICSPDELNKVAGDLFHEQKLTQTTEKVLHQNIAPKYQVERVTEPEKTITDTHALSLPGLKMRRIVISIADSASHGIQARDIPGIIYIENRIDTRSSLKFTFENDLITWNNTDRYFTNGITIELKAPWVSRITASRLLLPYRHPSASSTSLLLVQNMYTSADTRIPPTLLNDRPFSSYIYLGIRKTNIDYTRRLRLNSTLYAGVIGPYSPGSFFQTLVHKTFPTNDIPQGWETQINSDIILNYNISLEKHLSGSKLWNISALADVQAGTLYNNLGGGFRAQFGLSEPRFGSPDKVTHQKWQAYIYTQGIAKFIAYDATLQGGMINQDNTYTLKTSQVNHLTGKAEIGVHIDYKGLGIEAAQHFLTPEFKEGMSHRWGQLSLLFPL